jgi:xanthine dehydrogenase YagR molybdenum-binding subunit
MDYNIPAEATLIDAGRTVGHPLDRVDGLAKAQGRARYSYEYPVENVAYGYIVTAGSGKAKLTFIDTAKAEKAAGVQLVWTYKNVPKSQDRAPALGRRYLALR